jgi:hypothetical protein
MTNRIVVTSERPPLSDHPFCSCNVHIPGKMDNLIREGHTVDQAKRAATSSYQPWRDRNITIRQMISCTAINVKVAMDHADVCPEKVSHTEIFFAFWAAASSRPRGISQTMLRALQTAARRVKNPEVDCLFDMREVHCA